MSYNLDKYNEILSTSDLREILGIGANQAYNLLTSGKIKSFKIGSVRKIPKWCLIKYLDESIAYIHNSEEGEKNDSILKN